MGGHPVGFNPVSHAGSMREMTNSSGAIQDQRNYDPYGRVTQLQGTLAGHFQYGGYYMHVRSGLNLTRTRAYASSQGRFISRDPIEENGGINLFAYVNNGPTNFADPSGLLQSDPTGGTATSGGIRGSRTSTLPAPSHRHHWTNVT